MNNKISAGAADILRQQPALFVYKKTPHLIAGLISSDL